MMILAPQKSFVKVGVLQRRLFFFQTSDSGSTINNVASLDVTGNVSGDVTLSNGTWVGTASGTVIGQGTNTDSTISSTSKVSASVTVTLVQDTVTQDGNNVTVTMTVDPQTVNTGDGDPIELSGTLQVVPGETIQGTGPSAGPVPVSGNVTGTMDVFCNSSSQGCLRIVGNQS